MRAAIHCVQQLQRRMPPRDPERTRHTTGCAGLRRGATDMRTPTRVRGVLALGAAAAVTLVAACAPPSDDTSSSDSGGKSAASATSAADVGGMDALVAAAKKEGTLNVIALPPDWANYGEIIKAFTAKYGIKVSSAQPDGSSQDEINAVNQLKGSGRAPDVLDVGMAVALANTQLFAPYKV